MGVPSLNDLAVDGTLNTTNQPTKSELSMVRTQTLRDCEVIIWIPNNIHFKSKKLSVYQIAKNELTINVKFLIENI